MVSEEFRSEEELVRCLSELLECDGREPVAAVPVLNRCMDLATYQDGVLIGYECKLNAWSKALVQATRYLVAVDRAYVVLPIRAWTLRLRDQASQSGVGVLLCSAEVGLVEQVPPLDSSLIWPPARNWVLEALRTRVGERD